MRGGKKEVTYSHDLFTQDALGYIRTASEGKQPFFLYLAYAIPHTRFQVPDLGQYAETDWAPQHKIQAAMISRMDRDVGSILDLLVELEIDDQTMVFFSSDNGAHGKGGTLKQFRASGALRGRKRDVFEGGLRVPMIARWPGQVGAGTESAHVSAF